MGRNIRAIRRPNCLVPSTKVMVSLTRVLVIAASMMAVTATLWGREVPAREAMVNAMASTSASPDIMPAA